MRKLKDIQKDLYNLKTQELSLIGERSLAIKRKLLKCEHCNKRTRLGDTEYIQTYWYVTPRGCSGGDYWKMGEGQFECNKCGKINRLYKKPEIEEFKNYFKTIKKTYDR